MGLDRWRLVGFSVGFWVDLGVTRVRFWILDLGSAWIGGDQRSWWHGFGSAEIGDRAIMCVVCVASLVAPMVAPMVIFFF